MNLLFGSDHVYGTAASFLAQHFYQTPVLPQWLHYGFAVVTQLFPDWPLDKVYTVVSEIQITIMANPLFEGEKPLDSEEVATVSQTLKQWIVDYGVYYEKFRNPDATL